MRIGRALVLWNHPHHGDAFGHGQVQNSNKPCQIQIHCQRFQGIAQFKNRFVSIILTICFQVSIADEGMKGLVRGWAPTAIGYSAQV